MLPKYLKITRYLFVIAVLWIVLGIMPSHGQAPEEQQPLDMMLVIDNSCSMFPSDQIVPGCEIWGNDPNFLRLTGASLFIARLGFAEPNAEQYQVGVISLGESPPTLISPLKPLPSVRDSLAGAISSPQPALATQIVPALRLAYEQLQSSTQRRPGNQPAIVLLTDGAPFPKSGQSDAEIENLVASYPDIPIFMILLQNPGRPIEGYERYIFFWEEMQRKYQHIRTYRAADPREIERTYNEIVSILQNTIPTPGITLVPGQTLNVYVGKYVQRLILTVMHERIGPKGRVEITDSSGKLVQDFEADVVRFRGNDNPVEVISIGSTRLDQAPRDDIWTVTSDAPVVVFLDRAGAYSIQFVAPQISPTNLINQYETLNRHSPTQPLTVGLKLLDKAKAPLLDVQPISGRIVNPDGSTAFLRVPTDLKPSPDGIYEIPVDFATAYPPVLQAPGRFMLMFEAGIADERSGARLPIARADLLVDVGRGPSISSASPDPFICTAQQPFGLTVSLEDLDTARLDTVRVRVFGSGREVSLGSDGGNTYTGSLEGLCQAALSTLACGVTQDTTFRIRLVAELRDGTAATPVEYTLPVRVQQATCTPTPTPIPTATPVPTATPTPTPTPIPDTDSDGLNDLIDKCPDRAQWLYMPYFEGCPSPIWLLVILIILFIVLLAFLILFLIPWIIVHFINQPPSGYVLVCRDGKMDGGARSIRGVGLSVRRSKVTIGSKGHIRVSGMKQVELRIERKSKDTVIFDASTGISKITIRQQLKQKSPQPSYRYTSTADPSIVLIFGSYPEMRC